MCEAECLFCPCCRATQQRVISRDCGKRECGAVERLNLPGLYCKRCVDIYCREVGLKCCNEEWVLQREVDPTPRGKRCVVKVRTLVDVFGLEAKRLGL